MVDCSPRAGRFREYSERVFERFWRGQLDVERRESIAALLDEAGCDSATFSSYADSGGRQDLDACFAEADNDKIFGVPTFVVDGEPFWGEDRIEWVAKKLDALGLRY